MFSFQQGLSGEAVCPIVDSCQHLKKLSLPFIEQFFDDDVIHVIKTLGKQLTTLVLYGAVSQMLRICTLEIAPGNMML